jgi:hypothetical protein
MVASYLTGLAAILVILLAWVGVQLAWRRAFPAGCDPDALAGRSGCHGCAKRCEEEKR